MSRFLTAAAFVTAARALAFDGKPARATDAVVPDVTFHLPEITAAPDVKELLRRQNDQTVLIGPDNTCGYVSGRAGAAYTCGSGYTCAFVTESPVGFVACCSASNCGLRVTCLDYVQISSSSACDNGCLQDTFTAKCTQKTQPYCGTVTFFDGIMDYYCDSYSISTAQQLYTTYFGETDGRSFSAVAVPATNLISTTASDDGLFSTSSPTAHSSSSSATNSGGGDNGNSNGNNGNGNGNNNSGSKSSTPVGAIVGGVVGGVAVIALVGLGIFFIIRHNNNKKSNPTPEQPMQQTAVTGGPAPPPAGSPTYHQQAYNVPYGQPPYTNQPTPPQGYPLDQKPTGFVGLAPGAVPDRHDSTSPASQFSDNRNSVQPHSPTSTIHSNWGPQPGQNIHQTVPSVPPIVHEAGGNVVGERDYNSNHRGQFHEMSA
ncbi:hypothetical protein F5Y19DRAFT_199922 [Xylariaceae sp. FL1651]|nr:hypothetical protein F5Y19DRAFT_199922 [Xylariaceae sp. FL1651]